MEFVDLYKGIGSPGEKGDSANSTNPIGQVGSKWRRIPF
jgi:hypothetical protein